MGAIFHCLCKLFCFDFRLWLDRLLGFATAFYVLCVGFQITSSVSVPPLSAFFFSLCCLRFLVLLGCCFARSSSAEVEYFSLCSQVGVLL